MHLREPAATLERCGVAHRDDLALASRSRDRHSQYDAERPYGWPLDALVARGRLSEEGVEANASQLPRNVSLRLRTTFSGKFLANGGPEPLGRETGRVDHPPWPAGLAWSPRRNRTGDPILTMDRQPSAVLAGVSAARSAPWMLQLWAQFLHLHPGRLDRHRWCCQPPDAGVCCRGGISCASCLDPLQHLGRDEDRCRHQRRQVQRLAGPHVGGLDARAPSTDQASPPWVTTRPG